MRRILPVFTALLFAVLLPVSALALEGDEVVSIVVGSVSGENGDKIDVPVLLQNCAGVDSIQFDLNYDPAALSVVSVTPGDLFLPEYVIYNADESGRIRIACADALGLKGDGTLLTIRFTALSNNGSALAVTNGIITRVDADYQQTSAYVSFENGGVSIGGGIVPEALVTPWVPETPQPTATPEPTPEPAAAVSEPSPTAIAQETAVPETTLADGSVGPVSYLVVAVLFVLLVVLIIVSVRRRRNDADTESQKNNLSRKDS